MRAVVQDRYGPPEVLRIEEVDKPAPGHREVLIRVHASTVSQTDTHVRSASVVVYRLFLGLRRPRQRTLGIDVAGVVEAVGRGTTEFKPGDEVFGNVGFGAGRTRSTSSSPSATDHPQAREPDLRGPSHRLWMSAGLRRQCSVIELADT